jgi:hypothetical protein
MASTLLIVGIASILIAASLTAAAARHIRESRARVQALRQFALAEAPSPAADDGEGRSLAATTPLRRESTTAEAPLFAAVEEPAAPARRWMSLAAVAGIMGAAIAIVFVTADTARAPATAAQEARPADAETAPLPVTRAPVALVALRHDRDSGGALRISGQVRMPLDGAPMRDLRARITAFDADGRPLSTYDAAVDAASLPSGAVTAFSAIVPDARRVARYEIAFTSPDGQPVAHVDRRKTSG